MGPNSIEYMKLVFYIWIPNKTSILWTPGMLNPLCNPQIDKCETLQMLFKNSSQGLILVYTKWLSAFFEKVLKISILGLICSFPLNPLINHLISRCENWKILLKAFSNGLVATPKIKRVLYFQKVPKLALLAPNPLINHLISRCENCKLPLKDSFKGLVTIDQI